MSPLSPTTTTTTQLTGTSAVPVPGPVITYTRWIVPVPSAEGSKSAQKRGEALERAWRGVQSFNSDPDKDRSDGPDRGGDDEVVGGERERGEVQERDEGEGEGEEREKGQEKDKEQGDGKGMGRRVYAVIRVGEDGVSGLVVFEVGGEGVKSMELEGLQVTDKGNLDARKLVTCAAHGNDLQCLGSSRGCDVKWTPGDSITHWDALAEAMVEGRVWKNGRRVYANQYECHIWPISNDRLALDVRDRRTPLSEKAKGKRAYLDPLGIPAIPLGDYRPSPAQHTELVHQFSTAFGTKSFDPSSTAMQILADLEGHLDGGSDHASRAIWGVYWISTRTDLSASEDIRKHPGRVIIWPQALCRGAPQRSVGEYQPAMPRPVLTSSPPALMQLATGLFDFYTTYTPPEETVNEITPETEGPDGPDGLDDEGDGSEAYDPSEPFGPSPSSLPGLKGLSDVVGAGDGDGNAEGEAGSDIDDLFSAGSPSPPTATKKALPADGDGAIRQEGGDNAADARAGGLDDTARNQLVDFSGEGGDPDMSMDIDENLYAQMREWEDFSGGIEGVEGVDEDGEGLQRGIGGGLLGTRTVGSDGAVGGMVTEDDFNFFDSPPPPRLGDVEAGEVEVSAQQVIPVTDKGDGVIGGEGDGGAGHVGESAEIAGSDPIVSEQPPGDNRVVAIESNLLPIANDGARISGTSTTTTQPDDPPRAANADATAIQIESIASPPLVIDDTAPARRKTVTFEVEPSPAPPPYEDAELVPKEYEPLGITPTLTSFKFNLPSPASSPEASLPSMPSVPSRSTISTPMRQDLVKRLQAASRKKKDYSQDWDLTSEVSDQETVESFSGAPPTPISLADTEPGDLSSGGTGTPGVEGGTKSGKAGKTGKEGVEGLVWEGMEVLGPGEVVGLRWDSAENLAGMGWKDSWQRRGGRVDDEHADVTGGAGLDGRAERSLDEVDLNSLCEAMLSNRHLRELLLDRAQSSSGVASQEGGSSVELGEPAKPLAPCLIHVGMRDTVCQIAVSALLYARQLGIQPLGGEKDVEGLVIAESDYGRAEGFMAGMCAVYEAFNFGRHRRAKHSLAKDGIVSLPAAGFVDTLSAMMPNFPSHTVVYVLLPAFDPSALSHLISRLLSIKARKPDNVVVKLIPSRGYDPEALHAIALEIYDAITRPLVPISVRGTHIDLPVTSLQYPAFTLAPKEAPQVELMMKWPLRSYDALNRWRLVHCAYGFDGEGRVVAFAIDSAGEGWSVYRGDRGMGKGVGTEEADRLGALEGVWAFFSEFAKRTSVEYRLGVCVVGGVGKRDIEFWSKMSSSAGTPLTLLVSDQTNSTRNRRDVRMPGVVQPIPGAIFVDPTTRLIDETLSGTTTDLPRLPIAMASSADRLIPMSSFGLTIGQGDAATHSTWHVLIHRPPPKNPDKPDKEPDKANEVFPEEFYRLACLARTRYGMGGSGAHGGGNGDLPVHVGYVRMCLEVLGLVKE